MSVQPIAKSISIEEARYSTLRERVSATAVADRVTVR